MDAKAPESDARVIDAATAQLAGWVALAVSNQLVIPFVLPAAAAKTRLLHHAVDVGQLLAAGALSWLAVRTAHWLARRAGVSLAARGRQALLLGAAGLVVGLLTAGDDVSNLAERHDLPQWLLTLALALVFAVLLGGSRLLSAFTHPFARALLGFIGLALAIANALSLPADYFACHLLAAWLGALLVSYSVEGLSAPWLGGRARTVTASIMGVFGLAALLGPTPGDVRLRLYALPSSVLAPFAARWLPAGAGGAMAGVPPEYEASSWFKGRAGSPAVPPSRAVLPSKPPIVMFFTVDAFRADVLEKRELRKKLPAFTRLRKESTYFRVARSPTSSTMTTMASIFSGRYYSQLHWSGIKAEPLAEKTPRFPEILAEHGVRTMLAAGTLGQIYGKSGVARGFAKEVTIPSKPRPAAATVDAILTDLDAQPEGPIFIYSHFIEPHAPYDLAGKKGSKFQRYVGEIGLVDRELARLRQALEAKGLADRSYFIISADHGEGFGEHGTFNHARTVYEELVRVPLFVYAPGRAGRDVDVPVSGIDIGPTILDLFGLPTPGFWMGQSLLPVVAGKQSALERPLALDTGRRLQALCFDDGYKVIFSRLQHTTEVYDLRRDPGELNNLAESGDVRARQVIDIGEYFFANIALKEQGYEIPEHKF